MASAVGDTLVEGSVLLRVHGSGPPAPEDALVSAVHLKHERTFDQDPKYPIRLLVDIAIKALSPAINDPTTAVQTIDQLEDLLRRLGSAELDAGYVFDESGALRLVFPTPTWEDYLTLAFDEIRHFGSSSVQVMRRMRSALVGLADSMPKQERLEVVRRYLEHLDRVIEASPFDVEDKMNGPPRRPAGHWPVSAANGRDLTLCVVPGSILGHNLYPALPDPFDEAAIVAKVLVGVFDRELAHCVVERRVGTQVARNACRIARSRMRPRQRPGAKLAEFVQSREVPVFGNRRNFRIAKLTEIVIAANHSARPAKEDVARRLHETLARHHPLAVVSVHGLASVRLKHRLSCLLDLQENWIVIGRHK